MSPLARRAGPVPILLVPVLMLPGGLAITSVRAGLAAFAVMLAVLVPLAGEAVLRWRRLLPGLIALASVTWSNWLLAADRSWEAAVVAGMRVGYFVIPGVVLASFIEACALGDHLAQRLRIPARPVLAGVAALQRLDLAAAEWAALARARRIRGLGAGRNPLARARELVALTLALLIESLRQAQVLTAAMEARGYARLARPGARRTWAAPAPWTGADTALVLIGAALAALPALARMLLG